MKSKTDKQNNENKSEVNEMKEKMDSESLLEEYKKDIKRLQADFENYIKRTDKEKEDISRFAGSHIIKKLLNVADSFDSALASIKENYSDDVFKGVHMIYRQFFNLLKEEGVKPIDSLGKRFDPNMHEIIKHEPGYEDEEIIIKEIQKGYLFYDKVLRPSKVVVSKKIEKEAEKVILGGKNE